MEHLHKAAFFLQGNRQRRAFGASVFLVSARGRLSPLSVLETRSPRGSKTPIPRRGGLKPKKSTEPVKNQHRLRASDPYRAVIVSGERGTSQYAWKMAKMAEREGFEPQVPARGTAVFKTAPFGRSGISPHSSAGKDFRILFLELPLLQEIPLPITAAATSGEWVLSLLTKELSEELATFLRSEPRDDLRPMVVPRVNQDLKYGAVGTGQIGRASCRERV